MIILASVIQVLNMILIMIVALWFTMRWTGEIYMNKEVAPTPEFLEKVKRDKEEFDRKQREQNTINAFTKRYGDVRKALNK